MSIWPTINVHKTCYEQKREHTTDIKPIIIIMNNNNKIFIVLVVILKDFHESRLNYYRKIKENKEYYYVKSSVTQNSSTASIEWALFFPPCHSDYFDSPWGSNFFTLFNIPPLPCLVPTPWFPLCYHCSPCMTSLFCTTPYSHKSLHSTRVINTLFSTK